MTAMITAYVTHQRYPEHNLSRHPEHAGRIQAVWSQLQSSGLQERMMSLSPSPATESQILSVHTQEHLDRLKWIGNQDRLVMIDNDTYALPASYDIARLAAGGVVEAVSAVLGGRATRAIAAVRPPGHHATPDRQMGFCLLNNIAMGARFAQQNYKIERVMIIDYDVHHGNGTQDIFYDDETVLFLSTHQSPYYPGTGAFNETGIQDGLGYTINVPIAGGHGDDSYKAIFQELVWAAAERFQPQLFLISVGFDAHWVDPLAQMRLSLSGYDYLARECIKMADKLCDGKIVFVMEGGYDLQALSHGWYNIAHACLDDDELSDPYGDAPNALPLEQIQATIAKLKSLHSL